MVRVAKTHPKFKDTKTKKKARQNGMFQIRLVSFMILSDNAPDRMPLVTSQPPKSRALLQ